MLLSLSQRLFLPALSPPSPDCFPRRRDSLRLSLPFHLSGLSRPAHMLLSLSQRLFIPSLSPPSPDYFPRRHDSLRLSLPFHLSERKHVFHHNSARRGTARISSICFFSPGFLVFAASRGFLFRFFQIEDSRGGEFGAWNQWNRCYKASVFGWFELELEREMDGRMSKYREMECLPCIRGLVKEATRTDFGNEYVLKGSELLEEPHSDRLQSCGNNVKALRNMRQLQDATTSSARSQEASSSSSDTVGRETRTNQEGQLSPPEHHHQTKSPSVMSPESAGAGKNSLPGGSLSFTEYIVYMAEGGADASTETDDISRIGRAPDTCTRGISIDEEAMAVEMHGSRQQRIPALKEKAELAQGEISPPPSSSSTSSSDRKTETLESLIRAEATKMNGFRIFEEEELCILLNTKLKALNVLMQIISCRSIFVKDHHILGLIPTYKPRFTHAKFHSPYFSRSMVLGELDYLTENPRLMGLRLEDKEYFSGNLIETTKHREEQGVPGLKRSSSYNADRTCPSSEAGVSKENDMDTARSKCIPRAIKAASIKHSYSRTEIMRLPISDGARNSFAGADSLQSASPSVSKGGSKRITDPSRKRSSKRLDYKENEKLIKIEERLALGARRLAAGTAAEGAIVVGHRHRDGTRPATSHITHRLQSKHAT
ncbi:hypothetical protein ACLOJK_020097 [Asimina triloba]